MNDRTKQLFNHEQIEQEYKTEINSRKQLSNAFLFKEFEEIENTTLKIQ